jgi:hypothetical protein
VPPARAADQIPLVRGGNAFASCTGRAVSARRGRAVPAAGSVTAESAAAGSVTASVTAESAAAGSTAAGWAGRAPQAEAMILIVGPDGWPSPGRAIAAAAGRGFRVLISSELDDFLHYNLIKAAILPAYVDRETVATLQAQVESDPGILLTVDIGRREVRARGDFVARFEMDGGFEDMAERLRIAQRLLGSAALAGDARIWLQRRLVAICDALKLPGADVARIARRLDLLLTDLALTCRAEGGAARGGATVLSGPGAARNSRFP